MVQQARLVVQQARLVVQQARLVVQQARLAGSSVQIWSWSESNLRNRIMMLFPLVQFGALVAHDDLYVKYLFRPNNLACEYWYVSMRMCIHVCTHQRAHVCKYRETFKPGNHTYCQDAILDTTQY
jgi:hypothetical protein